MPWPTDADYNEAIQNPKIAFADAELQSGRIERNSLGLPKARSGNMATVYRIETGSSTFAVRCFLRHNVESGQRYAEIHSHFAKNPLAYMVGFQFIPKGIRVGPTWYPVVKMQWINGISISSYVETNLSNPARLRQLASEWVVMLATLKRAEISHGDLQHGNVLLVQGHLRLIDYDGCYVPALRGKLAMELGHANYQHPRRSAVQFGPNLDNFSAWLIYLSLIAAAGQPALWRQLRGGDECLLFRKRDLEAPHKSDAFRALTTHPDENVRILSRKLKGFLALDPGQVPPLFDYLAAPQSADLKTAPLLSARIWLEDHFNLTARVSTLKHGIRIFFGRLPGRSLTALKFFERSTLLIGAAVLLALLWLLTRSYKVISAVFLLAVDQWGIGKVMLAIGGFLLGAALLFQFRSYIRPPAQESSHTPQIHLVPRLLIGQWSGSGTASTPNRGTIRIQIAIGRQSRSRIRGTTCQGTLSLVDSSTAKATFSEHFPQQQAPCTDDTLTLTYLASGKVHFSKAGPAGTWQGQLSKMPGLPRQAGKPRVKP